MGNPISEELFLQRACSRFGDKYDYSAVIYRSYKSPIKIKCLIHPVKQIIITPEKHLQTTGGCKFCLREMRITMLERELQRPAIDRQSPDRQSPDGQPIGVIEQKTQIPLL